MTCANINDTRFMCGWCPGDVKFCGVQLECPNQILTNDISCYDSINVGALIGVPVAIAFLLFVVAPVMAVIVCCLRRQRKLQHKLHLAQQLANERY